MDSMYPIPAGRAGTAKSWVGGCLQEDENKGQGPFSVDK